MLKYLNNSLINTTFPKVQISLKMLICMPYCNASREGPFSVLKRIENYIRSSLVNEKPLPL